MMIALTTVKIAALTVITMGALSITTSLTEYRNHDSNVTMAELSIITITALVSLSIYMTIHICNRYNML